MSDTTVTFERVRECIEQGPTSAVVELLEPHSPEDLKHLLKEIRKLRTELRGREDGLDWQQARAREGRNVVAALLCVQTPAQAAAWLGGERPYFAYRGSVSSDTDLLTARHDAAWVADLAVRLTGRLRPTSSLAYWEFLDSLARASGAEVPINAGYVAGWALAFSRVRRRRSPGSAVYASPTLRAWLRSEPRLRECVAGLFEFEGNGARIAEPSYYGGREADDQWPAALAGLADEGALSREELIDACVARLLRGDRSGSLRGYLQVYAELKPTTAETRSRLSAYLGMAASAAPTVAKVAVRELRALDAEEPFEVTEFAAFSTSMLMRPESGLAGTQVAWLNAAIRRDRGTSAILLPCLGTAFAHPATSVQLKALNVAAKYVGEADARVLAELRDAAQNVDPAIAAEVERLIGVNTAAGDIGAQAAPPPPELPEYRPSEPASMPVSPEELVTAFAPSFSGIETSAMEIEQIMASVTVLAHQDRERLKAVFRPLAERHDAADDTRTVEAWRLTTFAGALCALFNAVLGRESRSGRVTTQHGDSPALTFATLYRIQELTDHLLYRGTVPVLLATPTEASGALDPGVFEIRMARYRELGLTPLRLDLQQARIRMGQQSDAQRQEARTRLALAEAFSPDELPALQSSVPEMPSADLGQTVVPPARLARRPVGRTTAAQASFVDLHTILLRELTYEGKYRFPVHSGAGREHWPALLPYDPDEVAVNAMSAMYDQANSTGQGSRTIFPALAETAGRPGPLTHLALAYGLAAGNAENRIAAQDAFLILAARGLLIPAQLGGFAAGLWQKDLITGKRLLESLGRLEQAGAGREVFAAVAALIAYTAATRPAGRGLPDYLMLASRCVANAGIRRVHIPHLAQLASEAKQGTRLAAEVQRLIDLLFPAGIPVSEP